jgi:hypothetical protein
LPAGAYFLGVLTATSYLFSFRLSFGRVRNASAHVREISFDRIWTESRTIYEFR